jgi:hypothetical protein
VPLNFYKHIILKNIILFIDKNQLENNFFSFYFFSAKSVNMFIKNKIEIFKKPLEVIANKFEGFIVS